MELPVAGTTKQYLPDAVGGWMYVVVTTITVEQRRLDQFEADVIDAQKELELAQAKVDDLQAAADVVAALPNPAPKPKDGIGEGTALPLK